MFEIKRTDEAAIAELQQLLERCSDYYELHEGRPAPSTAAADEWDTVPQTVPRDTLHVLIWREGDRMIGEMTLLFNYPKPNEWWVALFVVDPEFRSRGYGRRFCEEAFGSLSGESVVIAVDEQNPRGERFWRSRGFVENRRVDHNNHRLIIMRRAL